MNEKKVRWIFGLATMFFWASEYCHVPFFTPYLRTLGLSATLIGFLVGCYGFTQLCIRIPLGIFADMVRPLPIPGASRMLFYDSVFIGIVSDTKCILDVRMPRIGWCGSVYLGSLYGHVYGIFPARGRLQGHCPD